MPFQALVPVCRPISKEICEANTTIMCPMCEDTCEPWTLSDSCVYAKVSADTAFQFSAALEGFHPDHSCKTESCRVVILALTGHDLIDHGAPVGCHSNNILFGF